MAQRVFGETLNYGTFVAKILILLCELKKMAYLHCEPNKHFKQASYSDGKYLDLKLSDFINFLLSISMCAQSEIPSQDP